MQWNSLLRNSKLSQEASFPWPDAGSQSVLWRGSIGVGGQSLCRAPESALAVEERAGGPGWPSRRLQTRSHNGLRSYLAPLAGGRGAQSWFWKFGLKTWIYRPVRGDGCLVDSRLGGEIGLGGAREKQGSGEGKPRSPGERVQTVAELTWADINNKALGWAATNPHCPPPPPPRGICGHYRLFLLSRRQSQDVWVLPHLHPANTPAIQCCAILILCPLPSCFTAQL